MSTGASGSGLTIVGALTSLGGESSVSLIFFPLSVCWEDSGKVVVVVASVETTKAVVVSGGGGMKH